MPQKTLVSRRERLSQARLCVLVAGGPSAAACAEQVAAIAAAGAELIQLRDKNLDDAALLERAIAAVAVARRYGALLVINDRPDIAVAAAADGVHLGERDMPVLAARRVVGSSRLVGRTAHTIEEARAALRDAADYLGVGPCFPSGTKAFEAFAPQTFLEAVVSEAEVPAFAIGGIEPQRIAQLRALGLSRVAVASAVTRADDPAAAVASLLAALREVS
jgi:thiamine-phosphate pyrophosphorylase